LNDVMLGGSTIQADIFSILLRFGQYDIVVTADVTKMYRQIHIVESQRKL